MVTTMNLGFRDTLGNKVVLATRTTTRLVMATWTGGTTEIAATASIYLYCLPVAKISYISDKIVKDCFHHHIDEIVLAMYLLSYDRPGRVIFLIPSN